MYPFRRLAVWRRAHALAIHVLELTDLLRPGSHTSLIHQMRRAALSIAANIAEGCGRATDRQLAHFLEIALASARELDYHALLAHDLRVIGPADYARVEARVDEVCRMLVVLRRRVLERVRNSRRGGSTDPDRSRRPRMADHPPPLSHLPPD